MNCGDAPPTAATTRAPLSPNAWLRHGLIWRALRRAPEAARLLEVGCGGGAMAARLCSVYEYVGYEPDPAGWEAARGRVGDRGEVINDYLPQPYGEPFDVVAAFEVLEHIEDDTASLRSWLSWLRPGGLLVVSVPAQPERFGPADEAVGHFRRYSRQQLEGLMVAAGFVETAVWSYGFPLGYALEFARNRLARSHPDTTQQDRILASGRWRQPPPVLGMATRLATAPFRVVQWPFTSTRFGTGFVASARRPS